MQSVREAARRTPVRDKVDVLIAGGGTAGFAAAIAAARNGVSCLVVDNLGCLGGTFTAGCVYWVDGLWGLHPKTNEHTPVVRGVLYELWDRAKERGIVDGWNFQPEENKYLIEQMVLEAGAKILYHALVVDVVREGDSIKGIIVESKSGREAILADVVVDCTGDADVAHRAGVPCTQTDHWLGPGYFYCLNMSDEASRKIAQHQDEISEFHAEVRSESQTLKALYVPDWGQPLRSAGKSFVSNVCKVTVGTDYNMVDARDLTRLEIDARRGVFENLRRFKQRFSFANDVYVVAFSRHTARETRRIRADYVLTANDVASLRTFPDAVVKSPVFWEYHFMFDVPYRSLLPVCVEGMLVAGRCLGATRIAGDATRIISTCVGMGQAAGTAAALAVRSRTTPRGLDVEQLRHTLRDQGAELDVGFPLADYSSEQIKRFHAFPRQLREVFGYKDE